MAQEDKEKRVYVIDLRRIEGIGDFPCPHKGCGSTIDPDILSSYEQLDPKYSEKDKTVLEEMNIRCKKCRSKIRIVGFV